MAKSPIFWEYPRVSSCTSQHTHSSVRKTALQAARTALEFQVPFCFVMRLEKVWLLPGARSSEQDHCELDRVSMENLGISRRQAISENGIQGRKETKRR